MISKIAIIFTVLLALFSIGNILGIKLLRLIGLFFIFFIPGYLISLVFYKKLSILERFVYSIAISIPLTIILTLFLNIFLRLEFDTFFPIILFSILTFPLLIKIKIDKVEIKKVKFKLDKLSKILLFYIILSFLIRLILFLKVGTILGADVGRFTIISHTFFLKKNIVTDLQPYDSAKGFFYFPGSFLLPLNIELIGINPIDSITMASFLFSFISTLVFYLIAKKFLDRKKTINAFFFYSFVFDILLTLTIFGVFPYAFSILYFLIMCLVSLDMFFENKKRFLLLTLSMTGLLSFHIYLIFSLMVFLFSIFTYEFVNKKKFFVKSKTLVFSYIKASVVALILLFPFLIKFGQYFPISFSKDNVVDLMTFAHDREVMSIDEKLWNILFVPHIGLMYSSLFVIGIVSFVLSLKKFIKDKKIILVYFFIFLILQNFIIFNNLNLSRAVSFSWLVYPITFSFYLSNPFLNIVILPIFYFFESPSPLYLIKILTPIEQPGIVPWVVWSGYNEAIAFIRENTTIDSIFLIDGGGSGCTGASSDYGERIFPLTSRRIFYFTDYCWANYDKSEYRKRVEIYRKISINPDDHEALADLKGYNVTHVFIGPNDVGLNSKLFLNSSNYELIYDENKFQIFKIK